MLRSLVGDYARGLRLLLMALVIATGVLFGGGLLPTTAAGAAETAHTAVSLESGYFHTLLVTNAGTLWAWGDNSRGQLGLGDKGKKLSPVQVGTATNWKSVSAGWYHSLGVQADGTLWAWGDNSNGQLGLADKGRKSSPTQVGTGTNWVAVAAGQYHSLGLQADGTVWSWGSNDEGQLGRGGGSSVMQVGAASDWAAIAAGDRHCVAVRTDGTLWAWGWNEAYQLGVGDLNRRSAPVQVGTATNWASVGAEFRYSMGIRRDGTLWAWGWNTQAQLGVGDDVDKPVPTRVGTASNWSGVYPGRVHCHGIQSDGSLWGWGTNFDGELGLGDLIQRPVPSRLGTYAWVVASCGDAFSAGVRADGTVWGWGRNESGQLGTGDRAAAYRPAQCDMPAMDWPATVGTVAATRELGTMATLNGYLYSLGIGSTPAMVSFEWGRTTSYGQTTPAREMTATGAYSAGLSGLEPETRYHFRARVEDETGVSYGGDLSFKTTTAPPTAPDVDTADATNVSGSTARINGVVKKLGTAERISVWFEYGTEQGVYTWQTDNDTMGRTGAFYASLTGLSSGTTYYFRARGHGDGEDYGGEFAFTTEGTPTRPPKVETAPADQLTTRTGRLHGNVAEMGTASNVTVLFEWGESPGQYTAQTTAAGRTAGGGFHCDLDGLSPGRTYYYRALAVGDGTGYGVEVQFTVPTVVPEPASVSPGGVSLGVTATVTITGDAFTNCIGLDLGPGITVEDFAVVSANKITARITVASGIPLGARNVTVNTSDGSYTLPGGFVVRGEPRGGLPAWGWLAIAAGGIAVCGGALYLLLRRRSAAR